MNLAHFYHAFAAGSWRDPLAEHLAALADSGYDGAFHVGIVGSPAQRREVSEELRWLRPPASVTAADTGFEQVTLHALHAYALEHDGAVLYAHTKGAHDPSPINVAWRRSMTRHVVANWRAGVEALQRGRYDAVGCHWLTPQEHPAQVTTPMFGGNYWIATCDYVRRLPPCADTPRHAAEHWIGLGDPPVLDLSPGWPGQFGPAFAPRRLIAGR